MFVVLILFNVCCFNVVSATLAMSCGILLWFLSFSAPFSVITSGYVPIGVKILSTLLPNIAVSWGYRLMIAFETDSKYNY